ncbi:YcdB/YcdC domain-containing protein [Tepidimicrobium xylanilyticum]|uniref:YcdB/YcdC domain-containing protein n=1 Tax=Tepidimicrobium xylanilyticum TaxID=1123352 RepID=UPI00264FEA78|nr:YcdB/YcdC domain-containing protein [Tepidimicrobium xylanilyticum]GMG95498.1 hypothetical protein EN5CB1_03240 [Tepidimicrobium xylanilyticum]
MRRKIALFLTFVLALGVIPFSSYAEEAYDKQLEEAILRSRKLFNISSEYDQFDYSVGSWSGTTVFYLSWSDSKGKLDNVHVSIAVDGTVLSFGKWKPIYEDQRPKLPKISKEEGLNIAMDFIKKVSPKLGNSIKHIEISQPLNINSNSYGYYFVRIENGIPYYNNRIDISVDSSTGEVTDYYVNWDRDLKFADVKNLITLEKAKELYKEKVGLNLIYKTSYKDGKPNVFLTYSPLNTNLAINAKDGEVTSIYDFYPLYDKTADMGAGGYTSNEELSPDEKAAVEGIAGLISQGEAEKISREILELDSEYKLNYVNLYKNWRAEDSYNWQLDFTKGSDSNAYYVSVSIDAKTRELVSFYRFGPEDSNKKVQYNEEKSLEIAKEYIKKMNPDKIESIELRKNYEGYRPLEEQRQYSFQFIRKIDDAYVEQDGIWVTVDAVSGNIREYRIDWITTKFPPQENVISLDKAYDILFGDIGLELKYFSPNAHGEDIKDNKEAILVYGLKSDKPSIIDASTGALLNYLGEPFKEPEIIKYKDIENSYAKDKINILAQYGIALSGDKFKPKEKMKQADFLYLLAKAHSPYMEIDQSRDKLYTSLVGLGIIKEDEKAPERVVTKEEAVKYIIRALKYDKIADLTEIYKDIFKDTGDISPGLKGYISIAYGLKIVEGSNGYLNPKQELNREDGANLIYNYLFNEI